MSKRKFMAAIIITAFLVSLVAEIQTVKVTKANPLPYYFTPNHDEPILIVETPQNYTTYNVSSILLNFTVIRPSSWYTTMRTLFHMPAFGTISNITVSLNGNEEYYDEFPKGFVNGTSGWSENYSICVGPLDFGMNTLEINVTAYTYYVSQDYYEKSGEPINQYPMNVTDLIYLNFSESSPATKVPPSHSPSSSIEPSPTASVTPSPSVPEFASWIILPLLITVVIGVGLLVYFKKRKH